ncbi:MAG: hypothetical protein IPH35_24170 [Rhodoferax sp.]|nr:hypothetical protein [Rhodoferax sp.]
MSVSKDPLEKPLTSQAHKNLLEAAQGVGYDSDTVRQLLRLINAHPHLVAHARVFANIAEYLAVIQTGKLGIVAEWGQYIASWIDFCRWAADNADAITTLPGLDQFNHQPENEHDHPLLGEGVDRHGVVTALWNRHQSSPSYPPDPDNRQALRFFYLQTHVLLSYVQARWKYAELNFYENYDGKKERPVAPALSGAATRSIREFSLQTYDQFLSLLSPELPVPEFFVDIAKFRGNLASLPLDIQAKAGNYLSALKRYFRGAWNVHKGKKPRRPQHGGGGGSKAKRERRPGFIHFASEGVEFEKSRYTTEDADFPESVGEMVWIDTGSGDDDTPRQMELSGLAPTETLEPIFRLVDADEYRKSIQRLHFASLAQEMAAQSYSWSWEKLGRGEQKVLWHAIENAIAEFRQNPTNKSVARYRLIAALVLKFMMVLGQTQERAKELKIKWIESAHQLAQFDQETYDYPVLFATKTGEGQAIALGFGLPAIEPDYKTELEDEQHALSRPLSSFIVLPDLCGLAQQLLNFYHEERRFNDHIFGIEPRTLSEKIGDLLGPLGSRFTPTKVALVMPSQIVRQTGDISLAWVVCSIDSRRNESRMYYTRHTIKKIRATYIQAATSILRLVGYTPQLSITLEEEEDMPSVGARFVLRFDLLKDVITNLKAMLTKRYPDTLSRAYIFKYDQYYLFYTYLMLSISTGIRAVVKPVGLYSDWCLAGGPYYGFYSGLSDKESMYFDKSRLVEVLPELAKQFKNYQVHVKFLLSQINLRGQWESAKLQDQLLLVLDGKQNITALSPTWIEEQFKEHLGPVPANFNRAFMRTELLERGVAAELVDAFLAMPTSEKARIRCFPVSISDVRSKFWLRSLHRSLMNLAWFPLKAGWYLIQAV